MIISPQRKFIYVHLEKCGGTSIEWQYEWHQKWDDIVLGSTEMGEVYQHPYYQKFGLWKHSTASEIRGVIGPHHWRSYYSFATVRNPWSLLISLFSFCNDVMEAELLRSGVSAPSVPIPMPQLAELPDVFPWNWTPFQIFLNTRGCEFQFEAFVAEGLASGAQAFHPQSSRLSDKELKPLVDEVFQLESLDEHWASICSKIGIPCTDLHRANASMKNVSHYTLRKKSGLVDEVAKFYKMDYRVFGYSSACSDIQII